MAIKQISPNTENNVKLYTCSVTDKVFDYPIDCDNLSRMEIRDANDFTVSQQMFLDGKWGYIHHETSLEDLIVYEPILDIENKFSINMLNKLFKKAYINNVYDIIQVETATVVGTITTAGDATVIVTAGGITGSPFTLHVAVELDDTASEVAEKIKVEMAKKTALVAVWEIGGTGADITLTRKVASADDTDLNISIANDTCAGLTDAVASVDTTAGGINDKTIEFLNVPRDCELKIDMYYDGGRITWDDGITWLAEFTPTAGKTGQYEFKTHDGGTTWMGRFIGEW